MSIFNFLENEPIYKNQIQKFEYIENNLNYLYNNPKRAYHNWNHIDFCLKEFDKFLNVCIIDKDGLNNISLALIYHDCVYNPQNMNNEELSAQKAYIDLSSVNYDFRRYSLLDKIYNYILDTKHNKEPIDEYSKIICDIDMSILGQDWFDFKIYNMQIENEHSYLQKNKYYQNRIKFLESLLNKKTIYHTDYFQRKYEETSRYNIKKCLIEMEEIFKIQNCV